jgi:uncharacterized membrane protein
MKILRRLVFALAPPPRRPVTWQTSLPLILFLAAFAALCFGLEYGKVLMFARPLALAVVLLAPWFWWMHASGYAGLPKTRGVVSLLVRLSLLGLFAMVLAEPRAVRSRDVMSAIFVVDVSDSIRSESTDASLRYVLESVQQKPVNDEAGLIIFGKTPAVELPPRMSFPFEALNSQLERGATNIEQALSLAGAMLPEDNQGRIVLITDGSQTEGSLVRVLDELKSRQIAVDVLPIDYSYTVEVWLERLELPQSVKLGETYEAAMIVSALSDGRGTLTLRENGETIAELPVDYKAGKNRFTVPIALRTPGYYEYTATIEVPRSDDSLPQNNSVLNYIFVEGEGKTLLVTDPQGDARDWRKLEQAVREAERSVETIVADDLPRDAAPLRNYDCIIFVNVPHDVFDALQLQAVRDAVYNFGVGFLMVGGRNSFGPGGWHRSVVEEILPVTMDVSQRKVLPKGALAIILHTCEFPEGNTWGKRITKQAIKVLGAQDEVGVLAYDYREGETWIVKLRPAGEYDEIAPLIDGAEIGDMPSFSNTMEMGLAGLQDSDASAKHMIIISDGDPSPAPPPLVQKFIDSKISVSTVAIFPHGGNEISNMRNVAEVTGGRYYFPQDPNQLPAIFIKESKTLKRTMIRNEQVSPEVNFPSPILKGLEGIPDLKGYVLATPRDRAMTILQSPPDKDDPSQVDPILAVWQYGLGKTAAFTSDLSPNWGAFWYQWDKYQAFVKQLLTDISRVRKEGSLRLSTYTSGGDGVLIVEDFHPDEAFLEMQARVMGPGGKAEAVPLKQVAPRRYQANVPLWGHGRYHVAVNGTGGERADQVFGGFVVPYSPEYLRFRSNRQILNEIAERTSGQILTGDPKDDKIYERGRSVKRSTKPIFDWFLVALAILVPIDVAIRRVQLDWAAIRSLFVFERKKGPATATMGALLERKQAVASELQSKREERPMDVKPTFGAAGGPAKRPAPPPSVAAPKPPPTADVSDDKPTSTTERLLQLKRKRDEEKK